MAESDLAKNLLCDKIYPMKLLARLLLVVLTISIGCVTPMLPGETASAISHKVTCCAEMNMDGCHSCPVNTGATHPRSASTCCTGQSSCLLLYLTGTTPLVTGMHMIGTVGLINARATARAQRPPVPPPRISFS
jgi:hypothetical protein